MCCNAPAGVWFVGVATPSHMACRNAAVCTSGYVTCSFRKKTLKYNPQHSCKPCGKVWQPQQTTPQLVRCSTQLTPPVQTGRSHQRGRNTACRQDGACCAQGQGVQGCAPTNQESQSKPKIIGSAGGVGMQATCKQGGSKCTPRTQQMTHQTCSSLPAHCRKQTYLKHH